MVEKNTWEQKDLLNMYPAILQLEVSVEDEGAATIVFRAPTSPALVEALTMLSVLPLEELAALLLEHAPGASYQAFVRRLKSPPELSPVEREAFIKLLETKNSPPLVFAVARTIGSKGLGLDESLPVIDVPLLFQITASSVIHAMKAIKLSLEEEGIRAFALQVASKEK